MKIRVKDALNVLGLSNRSGLSFEDIKRGYRKACMLYHPDRNSCGLEMMKLVNEAWGVLQGWDFVESDEVGESVDNVDLGEEMNAALNAVVGLGLEIEICGSWIWVSGDTKPHKETLKAAGYTWAPIKKMWSWKAAGYKRRFKGQWEMEKIRIVHGSNAVKPQYRTRIE